MTALEKLQLKNDEGKFICVGLDTDPDKIPAHLKKYDNPVLEFNKAIIEATKNGAAAYKLNFAFYESMGVDGMKTLEESIKLIPPDILIIGDAKRGDIGNTSKMYAKAIFDYFGCDASTVHPYMGEDSVLPFLEKENKINFVLALTSNPGADNFEKLILNDGSYLFQQVIKKVKDWNNRRNCGIVFGATKITELRENIKLFGNLPVLLPGVGAQGGSLEEVMKVFKAEGRFDLLVNVSRGIIYRGSGENFDALAANELTLLNNIVENTLNI